MVEGLRRARRAAFFASLAEVVRVEAKVAALKMLKIRLVGGYPHRPPAARILSEAPGIL